MFSGLVTHQFEGIAPFEKALSLSGQAFQPDRFHLAAILLVLETALAHLIVIEFAFDPLAGAMEEVDGRPQQVAEVGLEARVLQTGNQGVEDVGDGTGHTIAFGQRAGIGFILEGAVAVKLEFLQYMVGWGRVVMRFKVVVLVHRMLHRLDRALAAFMAMKPTNGLALHP
jgi:hypothetical protein